MPVLSAIAVDRENEIATERLSKLEPKPNGSVTIFCAGCKSVQNTNVGLTLLVRESVPRPSPERGRILYLSFHPHFFQPPE